MSDINCDHEQYRDLYTNEVSMTCFCFCGLCYDHTLLIREGNGCIDDDCFCRKPPNGNCRAGATNLQLPDTVEKVTQFDREPVEKVLIDMPEKPGKTGTCRECKGPTTRNGNRGRFPILCGSCK